MKWIGFSCMVSLLPVAAVTADSLVGGRLPTLTRPLEPLRRELERTTDQLPLKKDIVDTTHSVQEKLPKRLNIVGQDGKTVMVEVRVENGFRAIEYEWLITISDEQRPLLASLPMQIIADTPFADLGIRVIRFRVSAELDSYEALYQRLPPILHSALDRNHVFVAQNDSSDQHNDAANNSGAVCDNAVHIGIIDTAIQQQHPAFAAREIVQRSFIDEQLKSPLAHGTAVASLLIGRYQTLQPLLPNAVLYNAAVFYPRQSATQGATTLHLIQAIDWLLQQQIRVINMSLAGPDNRLLAIALTRAQRRGAIFVAAAGNEGPSAPPRYPAAYPDVIAVTAVDKKQKIYRWANRGPHIHFAALGVGVLTASGKDELDEQSGTSMATPVVAAFVACAHQSETDREKIVQQLSARSVDLGDKGRDAIFGFGELRR